MAKIITLWQPWASLIALGHKKYETRSWKTKYRGELIIHAAKRKVVLDELARVSYDSVGHLEYSYLKSIDFPLGMIVAKCELTDCFTILNSPMYGALSSNIVISSIPTLERAVGDWQSGRFAWELSDVSAVKPVPYKGSQGIGILDPDTYCSLENLS